jgi:1-acyl-sn-glycerol-3-phosphate acyltransferase
MVLPPVSDHGPAVTVEARLEMSPASRIVYRILRVLLALVAHLVFRITVIGVDNVPSRGAYILAPGAHRSILDTPVVSLAGARVLRYMGAENYFAIPGLGWFLRAMGGFPVERSLTDRAALRTAEAILDAGEPLVLFPESTRQQGPLIEKLKEGPAFLACRAGAPVVPVGIGGAERAMPKGSRFIRPAKIVLVIGRPLQPPARGSRRVKRSEVTALTEQLRRTLQGLHDQAQLAAGVQIRDRAVMSAARGGAIEGGRRSN